MYLAFHGFFQKNLLSLGQTKGFVDSQYAIECNVTVAVSKLISSSIPECKVEAGKRLLLLSEMEGLR